MCHELVQRSINFAQKQTIADEHHEASSNSQYLNNMEYNEERLKALIAKCKWTFAKTMPTCPHEYIVRGKCALTDEEFLYFVHAQREYGVPERWWKYNFPYLHIDGYKYWTMGDTFENTTIINRAKEDSATSLNKEKDNLLSLSDAIQKEIIEQQRLLPYHLNILDESRIDENGHSRILCQLLKYTDIEGKFAWLSSFIANYTSFSDIKVVRPTITQEEERIDLWVRDKEGGYAIIIENKACDAVDQPAQLMRYIEQTKLQGFAEKNIYVIYLSRDGKEPEAQSWGKYKDAFSSRYANLTFRNAVLPWLQNNVFPSIEPKEECLKSGVVQYIDYLKGMFNLRDNDKAMTAMQNKIIADHLQLEGKSEKEAAKVLHEKLDELSALQKQMQSMREEYAQRIYKTWAQRMATDYPLLPSIDLKEDSRMIAGVAVRSQSGKVIDVFIGYDGKLYCQVQYHKVDSTQDSRPQVDDTLMQLRDKLNGHSKSSVWKYFQDYQFDEVYSLFDQMVERCQNL